MKKLMTLSCLLVAVLALCLGGCGLLPGGPDDTTAPETTAPATSAPTSTTPTVAAATVFTIDVNPGVRVSVDDEGIVLAAEATNEDGETLIVDLTLEGLHYEAAVEAIVDALHEAGYLAEEESTVLLSFEAEELPISEELNEALDTAFGKHGKRAAVIEQVLSELDRELGEALGELTERYHISEGKAHLVKRIREEMPELSAEELAEMPIGDLGLLLDGMSEAVKGYFRSREVAPRAELLSRDAALEAVLTALEITDSTTVENVHIRLTRREGKMAYDVDLIVADVRYTLLIDAETAEILEERSEAHAPVDLEGVLDDFCADRGIPKELLDFVFGHGNTPPAEKTKLTKGEILQKALEAGGIREDNIKRTDVRIESTEDGVYYLVRIECKSGERYEIVADAISGTVVSASCNGISIELAVDINTNTDTDTEGEQPDTDTEGSDTETAA